MVRHSATHRKAFRALNRLRELRAFEREHFQELEVFEERDLICEIGCRQGLRRALTMKEVFLLDLGSVATVQRRLRRLRQLGVVEQRRNARDARVQELRLTPKVLGVFARYDDFLQKGAAAS